MSHQPSHICPKCKGIRPANLFINEKGKPAKWCYYCRASYRDRLTNLHARDATKPKREEAISVDAITKQEGYANHPLANLLALSHIAGAKRALAIRDGNSWRGKKAWRAYYEAKRALEAALAPATRCEPMWGSCELPSGHPGPHAQRDPNSSGVS